MVSLESVRSRPLPHLPATRAEAETVPAPLQTAAILQIDTPDSRSHVLASANLEIAAGGALGRPDGSTFS